MFSEEVLAVIPSNSSSCRNFIQILGIKPSGSDLDESKAANIGAVLDRVPWALLDADVEFRGVHVVVLDSFGFGDSVEFVIFE